MAQKATVFKADLQIADLDRHYYQTHALTLARHPSETDERMMVRLLAFALYAGDALVFGKGISTEGEPALWQKDLTGIIERWIEVGQPDERAIRRACGRARHVVIVSYGRSAEPWWNQNRDALQRLDNLTVLGLPTAATQALAALAGRNMQLQCTIQEGLVWISTETGAVQIEPVALLRAAGDNPAIGRGSP
jgi:uncharacterized protein YaeQ